MARSFSASVDAWVHKSDRLMMAVAKESAHRVVDDMMTPQAKGGRFPVDTSYMRNSVTANIGSLPSGNSSSGDGPAGGGEKQIATTILSWRPGQILFVGIVANYSRVQEFRYGFVRTAAQKWQQTVREVSNELRRRADR